MRALFAQCKAEFLRTLRNRRFAVMSIVLPLLFYFVFSRAAGGGEQALERRFVLISMSAFSLVGTAINTFGLRLAAERAKGWNRFLKVTPLPPLAYLGAKLLVQTALNVLSLVVLFVSAWQFNHVTMPLSVWLGCFLWLLVGSIPFLALGALLGTALPVESAQLVGNILNLGLALLGGLWMPMQMLPDLVQQIGKWTPTYRFGSGAWNMVMGKAFDPQDLYVLIGYTILFVVLSIRMERRQQAQATA